MSRRKLHTEDIPAGEVDDAAWLDGLKREYIYPTREPGEYSLQELAARLGCTRKQAQRIVTEELAAGRMSRRMASLPGIVHPAMVYRRT